MRTRKVSVTFRKRAPESKHHKSPRMYYWNKHHECYFVQSSNFVLIEAEFHNERVYCIFIHKKILERTGGVELNYLFIQMTIERKMICLNIACHRPVWFHKWFMSSPSCFKPERSVKLHRKPYIKLLSFLPRYDWSRNLERTCKGRIQLNTVSAVKTLITPMTDVMLLLSNQNRLTRLHWNVTLILRNSNWHYDYFNEPA